MVMRRIYGVQLAYLLTVVLWFILVPLPFQGGRKPVHISTTPFCQFEYQKFT